MNDGALWYIDLNTGRSVQLASGGSRGDFMAVSHDGYLFATQADRVVRIGPPVFQPTPGSNPPPPDSDRFPVSLGDGKVWEVLQGYQCCYQTSPNGRLNFTSTHVCTKALKQIGFVPTYGCSDGFAWDIRLAGDANGSATTLENAFPIQAGTVSFVDRREGIVILAHGPFVDEFGQSRELCSIYAHLDSIPAGVGVGQQLQLDNPVGSIGMAGKANGVVHLHFGNFSRPTASPNCGLAKDNLRRPEPLSGFRVRVVRDDGGVANYEKSAWNANCSSSVSVNGVSALTGCQQTQYGSWQVASP
jgi:hypothetical protein